VLAAGRPRRRRRRPASCASDARRRAAKGKGVTVVTGLPLAGDALAALASELKRLCGSGGTVREGAIEIQGDHRDLLVAELAKRGFSAKRAGG